MSLIANDLNLERHQVARLVSHIVLIEIIQLANPQLMLAMQIKGGVGLVLQYGIVQSRFTRDFDISVPNRDKIFTELLNLDKVSWQGFSVGSTIIKKVYAPNGINPDQAVQRIDLGLKYLNSKWLTVRLDITNLEPFEGTHDLPLLLHSINTEIMSKLGFELDPVSRVISPELQVAEKLHAVTQPNTERGRDLFDIWLLIQNPKFNFALTIELLTQLELFRNTHRIPAKLLVTPQLANSFRAATEGLASPDLSDAVRACNDLLQMK